ncbi:MAG TPA: hypothetical protein VNJ12_03200 [Candidatus Dormibacteraeota bacterium]|nr:hypothetical protein [Candidatus Dormibacteraeota bacterium]
MKWMGAFVLALAMAMAASLNARADVFGSGQVAAASREVIEQRLGKVDREWLAMMRRGSGGDFALDNFKLTAIYGNIVLATDHVTRKGHTGDERKAAADILGTKVFVREGGTWKIAASVLLSLGSGPSMAASRQGVKGNGLGSHYADIEKQLWEVDRKWEEAIRNRDLAFMQQLYTRQCFIVLARGRIG